MKRRILRWLLTASVAAVLLLSALVLSAPFLITLIPLPRLEFDLAPHLTGSLAGTAESKTATVDLDIKRGTPDGYRIVASGRLLDWPYTVNANVRFGFIRADGDLQASLDGTPWRIYADFAAENAKEWRINANMSEFQLAHDEHVVSDILRRLAPAVASNLVFTGKFAMEAEASSTKKRPVPAWSARASLRNVDAAFQTKGGGTVETKNLRIRFGADGIANHFDIAPMFPRADSVTAAGIVLSNVFASVRATERSYLVTEAGADCWGGQLKLYSLFLDPKQLNAGATVFADGVDAGQVLDRIACFHGEASGRLHGKLPFVLKDGKSVYIKNAYLFSTPGETGKMRISDATPILENLERGGVSVEVRDNLAKALADLDYNVLRIELTRGEEGEESDLAIRLEGSATRGKTTVPVNLNITFHSDFDRLVNMGIQLKQLTSREKQK